MFNFQLTANLYMPLFFIFFRKLFSTSFSPDHESIMKMYLNILRDVLIMNAIQNFLVCVTDHMILLCLKCLEISKKHERYNCILSFSRLMGKQNKEKLVTYTRENRVNPIIPDAHYSEHRDELI